MEEATLVNIPLFNKFEKARRNFAMAGWVYNIAKVVLLSSVFALMLGMILSTSQDYAILRICVGFILIMEFFRMVRQQ